MQRYEVDNPREYIGEGSTGRYKMGRHIMVMYSDAMVYGVEEARADVQREREEILYLVDGLDPDTSKYEVARRIRSRCQKEAGPPKLEKLDFVWPSPYVGEPDGTKLVDVVNRLNEVISVVESLRKERA